MFAQVGVQEVDPDEHAAGPGGEGAVHHNTLLPHQGEP